MDHWAPLLRDCALRGILPTPEETKIDGEWSRPTPQQFVDALAPLVLEHEGQKSSLVHRQLSYLVAYFVRISPKLPSGSVTRSAHVWQLDVGRLWLQRGQVAGFRAVARLQQGSYSIPLALFAKQAETELPPEQRDPMLDVMLAVLCAVGASDALPPRRPTVLAAGLPGLATRILDITADLPLTAEDLRFAVCGRAPEAMAALLTSDPQRAAELKAVEADGGVSAACLAAPTVENSTVLEAWGAGGGRLQPNDLCLLGPGGPDELPWASQHSVAQHVAAKSVFARLLGKISRQAAHKHAPPALRIDWSRPSERLDSWLFFSPASRSPPSASPSSTPGTGTAPELLSLSPPSSPPSASPSSTPGTGTAPELLPLQHALHGTYSPPSSPSSAPPSASPSSTPGTGTAPELLPLQHALHGTYYLHELRAYQQRRWAAALPLLSPLPPLPRHARRAVIDFLAGEMTRPGPKVKKVGLRELRRRNRVACPPRSPSSPSSSPSSPSSCSSAGESAR